MPWARNHVDAADLVDERLQVRTTPAVRSVGLDSEFYHEIRLGGVYS